MAPTHLNYDPHQIKEILALELNTARYDPSVSCLTNMLRHSTKLDLKVGVRSYL